MKQCICEYTYSCICIHICIHTYMHTHMHTYLYAYIYTYIHTAILLAAMESAQNCVVNNNQAYTHAKRCNQAYVHTCIYTYIHAYIHTYLQLFSWLPWNQRKFVWYIITEHVDTHGGSFEQTMRALMTMLSQGMYICVCVCVYVCACMCAFVYVYVYVHVCVHSFIRGRSFEPTMRALMTMLSQGVYVCVCVCVTTIPGSGFHDLNKCPCAYEC